LVITPFLCLIFTQFLPYDLFKPACSNFYLTATGSGWLTVMASLEECQKV